MLPAHFVFAADQEHTGMALLTYLKKMPPKKKSSFPKLPAKKKLPSRTARSLAWKVSWTSSPLWLWPSSTRRVTSPPSRRCQWSPRRSAACATTAIGSTVAPASTVCLTLVTAPLESSSLQLHRWFTVHHLYSWLLLFPTKEIESWLPPHPVSTMHDPARPVRRRQQSSFTTSSSSSSSSKTTTELAPPRGSPWPTCLLDLKYYFLVIYDFCRTFKSE